MAVQTTNNGGNKTRAAKRLFFVGRTYILKAHHLTRQFSPGLVLSFVNVPSGMLPQEKPSQKKTDRLKRQAFKTYVLQLFDLSWRLAGAMLTPIFVGLYIDSKNDGGQTFALIGFAVGMVLGAIVIRSVVKRIAKGVRK